MGAGDLCLSVSKTTLPSPSRTATKPCIQLSSSGTATLLKFKLKHTRCIGIPNTVLLLTFHTKKINTIEMSWLGFMPSYQSPRNQTGLTMPKTQIYPNGYLNWRPMKSHLRIIDSSERD